MGGRLYFIEKEVGGRQGGWKTSGGRGTEKEGMGTLRMRNRFLELGKNMKLTEGRSPEHDQIFTVPRRVEEHTHTHKAHRSSRKVFLCKNGQLGKLVKFWMVVYCARRAKISLFLSLLFPCTHTNTRMHTHTHTHTHSNTHYKTAFTAGPASCHGWRKLWNK